MTIKEQMEKLKTLLADFSPEIIWCRNTIEELMAYHKSDSNSSIYLNFNGLVLTPFENGAVKIYEKCNIFLLSTALERGESPDDLLNKTVGVINKLTKGNSNYNILDINFDNYSGQYYYIEIEIKIK